MASVSAVPPSSSAAFLAEVADADAAARQRVAALRERYEALHAVPGAVEEYHRGLETDAHAAVTRENNEIIRHVLDSLGDRDEEMAVQLSRRERELEAAQPDAWLQRWSRDSAGGWGARADFPSLAPPALNGAAAGGGASRLFGLLHGPLAVTDAEGRSVRCEADWLRSDGAGGVRGPRDGAVGGGSRLYDLLDTSPVVVDTTGRPVRCDADWYRSVGAEDSPPVARGGLSESTYDLDAALARHLAREYDQEAVAAAASVSAMPQRTVEQQAPAVQGRRAAHPSAAAAAVPKGSRGPLVRLPSDSFVAGLLGKSGHGESRASGRPPAAAAAGGDEDAALQDDDLDRAIALSLADQGPAGGAEGLMPARQAPARLAPRFSGPSAHSAGVSREIPAVRSPPPLAAGSGAAALVDRRLSMRSDRVAAAPPPGSSLARASQASLQSGGSRGGGGSYSGDRPLSSAARAAYGGSTQASSGGGGRLALGSGGLLHRSGGLAGPGFPQPGISVVRPGSSGGVGAVRPGSSGGPSTGRGLDLVQQPPAAGSARRESGASKSSRI